MLTPNWVRSYELPHQPGFATREASTRVHGAEEIAVTRDGVGDVLLIEGDDSIAQMYALGLNLNGFRVHVATSRESVVSEVTSPTHFDAIVLDFELPRIGGISTLDCIRQREATADVPVIVLSNEYGLDFAEIKRHGANECHLMYRTTPRQLVAYVERAMRGAA